MTDEQLKKRKSRAPKTLAHLKKKYPHAKIALFYQSPIQLLAAVVLSAQCTDKKANEIRDEFGGNIPRTMKEITTLPGIARKSANVILGNAFGVVDGIAVDTHVLRFAKTCDLSDYDNPIKIEQDFMCLFPRKEWFLLTYRIIEHGRRSRTKEHKHELCLLRDLCNDPKF